jgi:hypothetical protein
MNFEKNENVKLEIKRFHLKCLLRLKIKTNKKKKSFKILLNVCRAQNVIN